MSPSPPDCVFDEERKMVDGTPSAFFFEFVLVVVLLVILTAAVVVVVVGVVATNLWLDTVVIHDGMMPLAKQPCSQCFFKRGILFL